MSQNSDALIEDMVSNIQMQRCGTQDLGKLSLNHSIEILRIFNSQLFSLENSDFLNAKKSFGIKSLVLDSKLLSTK